MSTNPTPTPTPPTDRPAEQADHDIDDVTSIRNLTATLVEIAPWAAPWERAVNGHLNAMHAERDALAARCAALYECVLDISDEAFLCGVSGDTSDRIREIERRARAITGDAAPGRPDRDGAGEMAS